MTLNVGYNLLHVKQIEPGEFRHLEAKKTLPGKSCFLNGESGVHK